MSESGRSWLAQFLEQDLFGKKNFKHYGEITGTLSFFDNVQRRAGIRGCIGEIGIAGGALFIPLALCCREDERAVAIDIFDRLDLNWNPHGGISSLVNLKKLIIGVIGSDDMVRYIEADSFFVTADEIRGVTGGNGFRLFSIDGAHSSHHTANDLKLAGTL